MSKLKKLLLSMFFVLVMCSGLVLSACTGNDDNMNIKLSTTDVQIILGENDNTAKLTATVSNAKTFDVIVDYDSADINVTAVYVEDGVTEITVVAYRQCTDVEVEVKGVKKSVSFFVSATTPVASITTRKDVHYIAYDADATSVGGQYLLSNDLIQIYPQDTKQTDIRFSLSNTYPGVSIENNYLTIAKDLTEVPSTIDVEAISVYNETVKATLHFEVVKAIDISKVSIFDAVTLAPAEPEYEINKTNNSVSLQIVVPFEVYNKELNVRPIFKYNDTGIGWDTKSVERDELNSVYKYTFEFNFTNSSSKDTIAVEEVWFELSYIEYPEIKTSTLNIIVDDVCKGIFKITKINEITDLAYFVDGVASSATSFDVYTTYKSVSSKGLEIQFETIPTNATSRDLALYVDPNNVNLVFLKITNSEGSLVNFVSGKYSFTAGEKFYFMAQSGFSEDASIDITIKSEENPEIQKVITIYLQEGITKFGFKDDLDLVEDKTYYLENNSESEYFERTIIFAHSPISVRAEKFKVIVGGEVFESDCQIVENEQYNDQDEIKYYDIKIKAIQGAVGQGTLTVRFQNGQEIVAKIIVIERLADVTIDVDTSVSISSAIGDIEYQDGGVKYVAIKYGQSLPIKYVSNSKIISMTYKFSDKLYYPEYDVYDEESEYGSFDNDSLLDKDGNSLVYSESSAIVRPDILRTTQTISPIEIGKVWIRVSFRGECLTEDFEFGMTEVSEFICVEVYNPVESIDVSVKNIEIYAFDEVGKANADLAKQNITIELNKNSAYKPTYNKILWGGQIIDEKNPYVYVAVGTEIDILKIEKLETSKYLLTVLTKTIPDLSPITFHSVDITAPDITGESAFWSTTINISIKDAILTSQITPTNVPTYKNKIICEHCNQVVSSEQSTCSVCNQTVKSTDNYYIYLLSKSISTQLTDNNFKILTQVLPENALNKRVVYEFVPDAGTKQNIISISTDGVVSVSGEIGGTGVIRVLPEDSILEDALGRQYYRENSPSVNIRIIVADGTSRETAIMVSELSEITNPALHYILQYKKYTTDKVLFDLFSGGLYGQNEYSDNNAIVVLQDTSLFNTLSMDAVVQDLVLCGTSQAGDTKFTINNSDVVVGGLLANVNNGTIKNIVVDLIDNKEISTVTSTRAGYTGGLVGVNNGTIQNSTFAGSVINTAGTVGGLVGANYGTITQSNVLIYNFKVDEEEMNLQGSTIGGLVGETFGTSTIEQCYIYNFGTSNAIATSTTFGALVGKISSAKSLIKECFAQVGNNNNFYTTLVDTIEEASVKSIIKNSYVLFKNGENYNFAYYMTQKNGGYLNGTSTSTNGVYSNVSFGATYVWNVSSSKNQGYPYLNNVRPVEQLTDLGNLKIQKTALSLEEENNTAVMYLYKTKNVVLTEKENNLLNVANTVSFVELFGTNSINGIMVSSNDESIISTSLNSLTIKNTGVVTLTIQSKYDLSIDAKQVTVCVLYYTSNLNLKIGNTVLGNNTVFSIKVSTTQKITSALQNTIVLFDREVAIMENNYIVNFYQTGEKSPYVVGDKIGTHVVSATFDDETLTFDVFLSLSLDSYSFDSDETKEYIQNIIKTNSLKHITAQKVYGPNAVTSTISKATISPSDNLIFDVIISSDLKDENLQYIVFDSNNKVVTNVFNISSLKLTNENFDTKYNVTLSIVRDNLENIETGDYKLRFLTTNHLIYTDVTITIIAQEVIRVDVNNYAQSGTMLEGTIYNYYPSNVITPNSSSLLDITLYPAYADYTHITVTSLPVNNESLALISMRKGSKASESLSAYYVDSANNSEFIENGVKIYKKITDDEIARYYVRVIASSAILIDSSYDIYIDVYNGTEIVYTQVYTLIVMPQEKPGLSVNGQDKIFALLGEEITVDIIKAKDQTLKQNYYISDNKGAVVVFNNDWTNYSTKYERATFTLYISETEITDFIFTVQTSAFINGKEEITQSSIYVYIIPFELDIKNTHLKNQQGDDIAIGDTYFNHELDFAFAGRYTNAGLEAFNMFVEQGYYVDDDYIVNTEAQISENPFKYGLYYVNNNNTYTPITNNQKSDSIVTFSFSTGEDGKERIYFLGNMLGTQRMLLEIKVQMPDGTIYTLKYFFTIQIKSELNDDEPTQINSASEFLAIFENQEEEHYILMKDIELYEYTPAADTSNIASFDGNGFTISIMSYNYDQTQTSANFALFDTVSENTTIKNLRLNIYNINEIALHSSATNEVNIATVAVTNQGIITNAEVVSYRSNRASDVIPAISGMNITIDSTINVTSRTAGFVVYNYGVITNSRVGGENTTEYTVNKTYGSVSTKSIVLTPFIISSFGEVSGFVHTNSGHITSSYASNIRVINNSNIDYATLTAGFAIYNQGIISMSYAKGVKSNENDVHADKYGIETTGIAAGFVYSNAGTVSDCYSNITLTNLNNPGRASAGFVYLNKEDAIVEKSLSLSRIIGSTTTQMNFVGVNEWGTYQNNGTVENSYYYDEVAMEDDSILVEKAYGESAREVGAVTLKDYFYGFNFTTDSGNDEDGIWKMSATGPDLVSANNKTVSLRYTSPLSTSEKPKTTYVDNYRYGSKNNPILIRNASEFNEVFAGTVNKSSSLFVNTVTKEVFGNYRIIKDIDLQELTAESDTYRLASSQMELTGNNSTAGNQESIGKIDGNGFTIKGFALSDASASGEIENFGMFAKITNGATIMNLNIVIGATNKEGEIFGVEAKNITNVGSLAGTVSDSKVVNVNLTSLYEDTNSVTVRGKNVVGGLVGKVEGNSYISNIVTTDVSVTAVNYPENYPSGSNYATFNSYSRIDNELNKGVSYAGGIVGAFDAYTSSSKNVYTFSDAVVSSNSNGIMLKTKGVMQITGGTVGGIAGYVGPLTIIQDALLDLTYIEDDSEQGLYSYNGFAGGIVGYNLGYLRQVRAEHNNKIILKDKNNQTYQDAIETGMASYYKQEDDSTIERGNELLFHNDNYYPIAIGGLVGLQKSGKIEKSYSKINVKTTNGFNLENGFAGGIIGVIEAQSSEEPATLLHEVYASGDVQQSIAVGGIVGYDKNENVSDSTKFEKVNAVNYWGKWILESKSVIVYAFTNGSTNGLEKSSARYLYEDLKSLIPSDAEDKEEQEQNLRDKLSSDYYINQAEDTPKYTDMNGVGDDGEMFDEIFKGNDWDPNSWSRDEDELFPHILFGYHSNVVILRNQNDIEQLRTNDESTAGNITYVIDPDDTPGNIHSGDTHLITIDKKFAPIVGFCNILRGVDDKKEYGFNFVDKNQTKALFKSTLNATFKDFSVYYNFGESKSSINFTNASAQGSALVEIANNTEFINLKFAQITMKNINTTRSTFGIACAIAKGSTKFNGIDFDNCKIVLDSNCYTVNAGLLFGSATVVGGGVNNVRFTNCSIDLTDGKIIGTDDSSNKSNIGSIGGILNYTGTENPKLNVVVSSYDNSGTGTGTNTIKSFTSTVNAGAGSIFKNVYLGGAFGSTNRVSLLGIQDTTNNTYSKAESIFTLDNITNCDVGGLVGNIREGSVGSITVIPKISIQKSLNSNVGGVSGFANYTQFDSINVGSYTNTDNIITREGFIDCNNIIQDDAKENIPANFGGLVGKFDNTESTISTISTVKTYIDIDLGVNAQESSSANAVTLYTGSIVGNANNVVLEDNGSYGDVITRNYYVASNLYVGGLIGKANNVSLNSIIKEVKTSGGSIEPVTYYNYSTGNLKNIVCYSGCAGCNILAMSGLIAQASGNIVLDGCIAAGNTYPTYKEVREDGETINNIENDIFAISFNELPEKDSLMANPQAFKENKYFAYGALIAKVENDTVIEMISNYSIDTFVNKIEEMVAETYVVNTFVGEDNSSNATYIYENASATAEGRDVYNRYSHVYTLVLNNNNIGEQNVYDLNGKQYIANTELNDINMIDVIKDRVNKDGYFVTGTKINYQKTIEQIITNKYVYIDSNINIDEIELKNSVVVSDGFAITFAPTKAKDSKFAKIDKNSIVSGVVINANYTFDDNKQSSAYIVAGFAKQNDGIIYSSVVRGREIIGQKVTGYIQSYKKVAGFVAENSGLIKNSYTDLNIVSYYNLGSSSTDEVTAAAFTLINTGYIVTSYAAGSIQNYDQNQNKTGTGKVYVFAPGNVYGCYSITKVLDKDLLGNAKKIIAFGNLDTKNNISTKDLIIKDSFYDIYAIEAKSISESGYAKKTSDVSLDYSSSAKLYTKELSKNYTYAGDLSCNIQYAYGYGSFCDGAFSNIEYIKHNTGTGTLTDYYQIPNLGKLKQIPETSESLTYYRLIQDIDGNYISDDDDTIISQSLSINWTSLDISNIELDGEEVVTGGNNHSIKSVKVYNGGLFNTVNNSTLKNLKLDKISVKELQADFDNVAQFGMLANKAIDTNITNIYIVQTLNFLQNIVYGATINKVVLGFVVGEFTNINKADAYISLCNVHMEKANEKDVNILQINETSFYDWTIGGIVGKLSGGTATQLQLTDSQFYVDFVSNPQVRDGKTYIVGGIVGEQTGGTITSSMLNAEIQAFTNEVNSGTNLVLYLGGIVGKIQSSAITYTNAAADSNIDSCMTQQGSKVIGGNHYSFRTVYVGGISGYGGAITNCKNKASVVAYAIYTYQPTASQINGYNSSGSDIVSQNYSVYNAGNILMKVQELVKVLYAELTQEAHAAGIANEYVYMINCVNNNAVKGGTKSKTLHSHYSVDTNNVFWTSFGFNKWIKASLISVTAGITLLATPEPTPATKIWGGILLGVGIASTIACFAVAISRTIDIQVTYMPGNGYDYVPNSISSFEKANYYIEEVYKSTLKANLSKDEIIKMRNRGDELFLYNGNNILPYGNPNPIDGKAISKAKLEQLAKQYYTKLKNTNNYYYSEEIQLRDIYFDSIGLSSVATPENCYSSYQVYNPITLDTDNNSSTVDEVYYALVDNSRILSAESKGENKIYNTVFEEYKIVYKDQNSSINKLTVANNPDNDSFGEDSGWEQIDGEWVISSVENNKADIKDLLNGTNKNVVSIEQDSESKKYTIKFDIYDIPGYNLMREIVNTRNEIKNKYEGMFAVATATEIARFNLLITALENLDHFEINIKAEIQGITTQLGTETYPFIGTFSGTKYGANYTKLTSVKNSTSSTFGGLFAYAKELEIKDINIEYSDYNYALTTNTETPVKAVGGIVGNLISGGNLSITNTNVSYRFKDYYYDDMNNTIASETPIAIGGIVGFADSASSISIGKDVIINDFSVDTKSKTGNIFIAGSNHRLAIGSVVASMDDANLYIASEGQFIIESISINCKSSNSIAGGIVGFSTTSDETLVEPNIIINDTIIKSGEISLETVTSSNVMVGGMIGRIDGGHVGLDKVQIQLSNISAKTAYEGAVEAYAGGIAGYVYEEDISGDGTMKVAYFSGLSLPEGKEDPNIILGDDSDLSINRIYITAGIGGKEYPTKAYSDAYFGNAMLCTELISSRSNIFANVKCYSMSKPGYTEYPKYNSEKLTTDGVVRSDNIIYEESYTENKLDKYFKVDTYEFETIINDDIKNSYNNGSESSTYNYRKQYLISVVMMTTLGVTFDTNDYGNAGSYAEKGGEVSYKYEELFYNLIIDGTMSENQDYSLTKNVKFELITSNRYFSKTDIYTNYKKVAYPLSNRVSLDENDIGYYPDPNVVGNYMVELISDLNNNSATLVDISLDQYKNTLKSNEAETNRNVMDNYVNLSFKFIYSTYTKTYKNIELRNDDETGKISLVANCAEASFNSDTSTEGSLTNSYTKPIVSFYNLYSTGNTKTELKYEIKASFTPNDIQIINTEQILIDLGNGSKLPVSNLYSSTEQSTYTLTAYMSNVFKVDGSDERQRRVLIISEYDKGKYNDEVYLIAGESNLIVYYMGNIKYTTSIKDFSTRNEFFFPSTVNYYENNLKPLNEISRVEEFKYKATIESSKGEYLIKLADDGVFIEKTTTISTRVYDIQLNLGLLNGISNVTASFNSIENATVENKQVDPDKNTGIAISNDVYEVNDVDEENDGVIVDETTGTTVGYFKSIILLINGESNEFKFIYDTTKQLQQIEKVTDGQTIYYDSTGNVLSYTNLSSVIWYKYDYSNNITYYRFSAIATGEDDSDSYSLKGIYGFSYDSTNKLITATNQDVNSVGISSIVFSSEGEHRISSITYTQNIKGIDASYDLFTITETYTETGSFVEIGENSKSITLETTLMAASMNGISESSMRNLIKVSLSDVILQGLQYIEIYTPTETLYVQAGNLAKLNIVKELDSAIVYQEQSDLNKVYIYLYQDGIYQKFDIVDRTENGLFTNNTIISVTVDDYIVIDYTYFDSIANEQKNSTVKLEINIEKLKGYVFTSKATGLSINLEYDSSFTVKYEVYYYDGATRFYFREYGDLIIDNQSGLSIKSLTPFGGTDNNYALNLSNGQSYTLGVNEFYEITGTVQTEGEIISEIMFDLFNGEFLLYRNKANYTDSNNQRHQIDETLLIRKSITLADTMDSKEYKDLSLIMEYIDYTDDEGNYVEDGIKKSLKITKVKRDISYDNNSGIYTITDTTTSEGTDSENLFTIKTQNFEKVINVGLSTDTTVVEYVYGVSEGQTTGPSWSKIIKINDKNIFTI